MRVSALPAGQLSEREAAKLVGVHKVTLAKWRMKGEGPPYWKGPGKYGQIKYFKRDVVLWMKDRIVGAA